jgi:hypothetical protein
VYAAERVRVEDLDVKEVLGEANIFSKFEAEDEGDRAVGAVTAAVEERLGAKAMGDAVEGV